MKYLLDTAPFLWAEFDQTEFLSEQATGLIRDPGSTLVLSSVSIWEISIKFSLRKLQMKIEPKELVEKLTLNRNIELLVISHIHATSVASLPFHHKDPFDRLLIAQAKVENLPILTPDTAFKKYDVEVVW